MSEPEATPYVSTGLEHELVCEAIEELPNGYSVIVGTHDDFGMVGEQPSKTDWDWPNFLKYNMKWGAETDRVERERVWIDYVKRTTKLEAAPTHIIPLVEWREDNCAAGYDGYWAYSNKIKEVLKLQSLEKAIADGASNEILRTIVAEYIEIPPILEWSMATKKWVVG